MRRPRLLTLASVIVGALAASAVSVSLPAAATAGSENDRRIANATLASVTFDGHGYGHGIGLSQWGAYGYAVDYSWTSAQILDHFYGGTTAGTSTVTTMTVRLLALDGAQTAVVHDTASLVVDGVTGGPFRTVVARETTANTYDIFVRADTSVCPAGATALTPETGWTLQATVVGPVVIHPATDTTYSTNVADLAAVCEPGGRVRSYRGSITALNATDGSNKTVNTVPVEQYLRGVVPSEVSWSWGLAAGGKGANALQAQAVAARSYAIADNRYTYAKTCDSQNCQVYAGAAWRSAVGASYTMVENPHTDAAIGATNAGVRINRAGGVAVTMFSASSGGHTAPSSLNYTPVVDLGDATSLNPSHNWTKVVAASTIQAVYPSVGALQTVTVTTRDGYGDFGGRATQVRVTGATTSVTVTGSSFASALGLKSSYFAVRNAPPPEPECGTRVPPPLGSPMETQPVAGFVPIAGQRIANSRTGLGVPSGLVGAGCTLTIATGQAGATAVAINVTSVLASSNGFITAYRCGQARPTISVLQSVGGATVGGSSVVPVDADGRLCVYTSATTHIIVDLVGRFGVGEGHRYTPINPVRRLDTRSGQPVAAGSTTTVSIVGSGVPTGARGAALTLHALGATGAGYATVYPCDTTRPSVSSINVVSGSNVTNHVETALATAGTICVYASVAMHLAVDVSGWYGSSASSLYRAMNPQRIVNTRTGLGIAARLTAGANPTVTIGGVAGVPSSASAVIAEVIAVAPSATGWLTVHPCLATVPSLSMNRYVTGTSAATAVSGVLSATDTWCVYTSAATDVIVDVSGYFEPMS